MRTAEGWKFTRRTFRGLSTSYFPLLSGEELLVLMHVSCDDPSGFINAHFSRVIYLMAERLNIDPKMIEAAGIVLRAGHIDLRPSVNRIARRLHSP